VAGLQGIHEVRPLFGRQDIYLVRPLLAFRHLELIAFLLKIDQPFCEDPSNVDLRFTRNRIRNELLPLLERDYNRNVVEALLRLSETAGGAQSAIEELVEDLVEEAVAFEDERNEVIVNRDMLAGINPHLVRELFVRIWRDMGWPQQQMGLDEWAELALVGAADLHDSDEGESEPDTTPYKRMFPGKIMVEKQGAALVLSRLP
jgi:tRNA(Ile)-lysidine synthase